MGCKCYLELTSRARRRTLCGLILLRRYNIQWFIWYTVATPQIVRLHRCQDPPPSSWTIHVDCEMLTVDPFHVDRRLQNVDCRPPPRINIGDHLFTWKGNCLFRQTTKCWKSILPPPSPDRHVNSPLIDTKTVLAFWSRFCNVKFFNIWMYACYTFASVSREYR